MTLAVLIAGDDLARERLPTAWSGAIGRLMAAPFAVIDWLHDGIPNDRDAAVTITIFFSDREPVGPYRVTVPRQRTLHVRFNDLKDPQPVPRDTDYASVIESDVPIVVQHTRLDSRAPSIALLFTVAFSDAAGRSRRPDRAPPFELRRLNAERAEHDARVFSYISSSMRRRVLSTATR